MDMNSGGLITSIGGKSGHTHPADDVDGIAKSSISQAGELIVGTGPGQADLLPPGPSGHALVSDDSSETGLSYEEVSKPGHTHDYAAADHTHPGVPIGTIVAFAGSSAPSGWLLCDGSDVSATTYPDLYTVCGTTYGVASQAGYFKIPSLRGRFPVGVTLGGTFPTLGGTGGSLSLTLSVSQMPTHSHTGEAHTHTTASHSHTATQHKHSIPSHNHANSSATLSISSDSSAHTHNFNISSTDTSSDTHNHGGVATPGNIADKNVATQSGTGATRVNGSSIASDTTGNDTHSHTFSYNGTTTGRTTGSSTHSHANSSVSLTISTEAQTDTGYVTDSDGAAGVTVNPGGGGNTGSAGSGSPIDITPPYVALNYMIKAI